MFARLFRRLFWALPPSTTPAPERAAIDQSRYRGQWIAIGRDGSVIGHGHDLGDCLTMAGDHPCTVIHVSERPEDDDAINMGL